MTQYKTQAITIKSHNLNESDKIIVMYSRDHGIIRCVAKGVKKPTSKLGGRMDLLIANDLLVYKGKNLDIALQAQTIDTFKGIRKDISKLTYAMHCAELLNNFGMEEDSNSSKIYDLFINTLKNIDLATDNTELMWSVVRFQLKLMELLGYAVELNTCAKCNCDIENDAYAFCSESGGIICGKCAETASNYFELNPDMRSVLKQAQVFDFSCRSDYDRVSSIEMTLNCCFNILKDYVSQRSHKKLKSSELIECLC